MRQSQKRRGRNVSKYENNETEDLRLFAELYVTGRFADAGWNVYFPRRDRGFDFIGSRIGLDGMELIRPSRSKGKSSEGGTGDRATYGMSES